MPAFQPPWNTHEKDDLWVRTTKPGFRNPKKLWTEYWQRFNTISIPLQDEDAFFLNLMEAAHRAETRPHLEELLEQKREERRRGMEKLVKELVFTSGDPRRYFPSPKARSATTQVSLTASLASFIQVVCGVAYGWNGENAVTSESWELQAPDELGDRGSSSPLDPLGEDDDMERENRKTFEPGPWTRWHDGEEDAYNDESWKVHECSDSEQLQPGRQRQRQPVQAAQMPQKEGDCRYLCASEDRSQATVRTASGEQILSSPVENGEKVATERETSTTNGDPPNRWSGLPKAVFNAATTAANYGFFNFSRIRSIERRIR